MKKEDGEENMQIMFEKYMEYIQLCPIHLSNMIHDWDICVKKLNKIKSIVMI